MSTPLEQALARIDDLTSPDDWVIAAACRGLMTGYAERWSDEQRFIRLESCEQVLQSPLRNINTARSSRTFDIAGKLDKLAFDDAGRTLYDHKTTSDDISDPAGPYWRQLAIDSQASHYELLCLANDLRVDRIVWDVTRKPGIRPKQIAAKDYKQTLGDGHYCGFEVSEETLAWLKENQRENGELYGYRVARESIDDPQRYFARRSIPRTREQLAEYAEELWEIAGAIRDAKNSGHHYRNSAACMTYGRPCEFMGLCSSSDTPDSDHWRKKPTIHAELGETAGNLDVLTNSRLRTFQTCRRKHYYQYELAIERAIDEQIEPLFFGSVWGQALDVFWQTFDKENRHGNCSEQSVRRTDSRQAQAGLAF
jgi:hypothetical protein